MGKFGARSPKRHVGWSNDEEFIGALVSSGGYLSVAEKNKLGQHKLAKTVRKATGKVTYTGLKDNLKASQCPCWIKPHVTNMLFVSVCYWLCLALSLCGSVAWFQSQQWALVLGGILLPLARRFWKFSGIVELLLAKLPVLDCNWLRFPSLFAFLGRKALRAQRPYAAGHGLVRL